ncbi:mt-a70-like [Anaeramoeba flamelloides]|uniref:Mt-a70-like n=1 Tax=Anaeramoeba flamelloides TaxID=1746091 RepID=A0ABQ8XEJ5_9EUKA|nr:mt-a70-like [Anaeramoeba flamelloides]
MSNYYQTRSSRSKRNKRRVDPIHYVGYVDENESTEEIMKRFKILEEIQKQEEEEKRKEEERKKKEEEQKQEQGEDKKQGQKVGDGDEKKQEEEKELGKQINTTETVMNEGLLKKYLENTKKIKIDEGRKKIIDPIDNSSSSEECYDFMTEEEIARIKKRKKKRLLREQFADPDYSFLSADSDPELIEENWDDQYSLNEYYITSSPESCFEEEIETIAEILKKHRKKKKKKKKQRRKRKRKESQEKTQKRREKKEEEESEGSNSLDTDNIINGLQNADTIYNEKTISEYINCMEIALKRLQKKKEQGNKKKNTANSREKKFGKNIKKFIKPKISQNEYQNHDNNYYFNNTIKDSIRTKKIKEKIMSIRFDTTMIRKKPKKADKTLFVLPKQPSDNWNVRMITPYGYNDPKRTYVLGENEHKPDLYHEVEDMIGFDLPSEKKKNISVIIADPPWKGIVEEDKRGKGGKSFLLENLFEMKILKYYRCYFAIWVIPKEIPALIHSMWVLGFKMVETIAWLTITPERIIFEKVKNDIRRIKLELFVFKHLDFKPKLNHQRNNDLNMECIRKKVGRINKKPNKVKNIFEDLCVKIPNTRFLYLWCDKNEYKPKWIHVHEVEK